MVILSVGALLPFFCHNVFGKKSKMFIGDGGTLLMGTILSAYVLSVLETNSLLAEKVEDHFGLIPFTIAMLAVPVFDTLRVMLMRIIRGKSPFQPDKTHLHHLFIDLGFSHIGTTITEIFLNVIVGVVWFTSYKLGASIDLQLYIVLFCGIMITFVFYRYARVQQRNDTKVYHFLMRLGKATHIGHTRGFERFRNYLDQGCDNIV